MKISHKKYIPIFHLQVYIKSIKLLNFLTARADKRGESLSQTALGLIILAAKQELGETQIIEEPKQPEDDGVLVLNED